MKWRCKTVGLSAIGLFGVLCTSLFYSPGNALGAREDSVFSVAIENEMASADIRGVTVARIIQKLEKECAIRFYADESILGEVIYVQFSNLPLQAGMKKIFSGINFIFYFLPNGTLVEVALLGKKGIDPGSSPVLKGGEDLPKTEPKAQEGKPKLRRERPFPRGTSPSLQRG